MAEYFDQDRRQFLGRTAMTIAAARLGMLGRLRAGGASASLAEALAEARTAAAKEGESRELAAIGGAATWLNSPRLTPTMLAGKVVLANFCTYTCINWLRTLPYVRAWARKYRENLIIVGVHTPEFAFEHKVDNVRRELQRMRVTYPIVIDNDYAIWRAFNNRYWPALYFLDPQGRVRHHHFGEGEYEQSEKIMQRLLAEAGAAGSDASGLSVDAVGAEAPADWPNLKSPENYVGYQRTEHFASPGGIERDRRRLYAAPASLALNHWALAGHWTMGAQAAVLNSPTGRIACRFHARDLHLVMGPSRQGVSGRFRVTLDGKPPGSAHGGDVDDGGNGTVVDQRLYQLIRQSSPIADRRFEIELLDAGVETFAFTFG